MLRAFRALMFLSPDQYGERDEPRRLPRIVVANHLLSYAPSAVLPLYTAHRLPASKCVANESTMVSVRISCWDIDIRSNACRQIVQLSDFWCVGRNIIAATASCSSMV
jgi:hypothetical protein